MKNRPAPLLTANITVNTARPRKRKWDPTDTFHIRNALCKQLKAKFTAVKAAVRNYVVAQDMLQLARRGVVQLANNSGCVIVPVRDARVGAAVASIHATLDLQDVVKLEVEPHVTALCGMLDLPTDTAGVAARIRPVAVRFGSLALFQGPDADVLYIAVESDGLREVNASLRDIPHLAKYPQYTPHLTVAYLKPGAGEAFASGLVPSGLEGVELQLARFVHSTEGESQVELVANAHAAHLEQFLHFAKGRMLSAVSDKTSLERATLAGFMRGAGRSFDLAKRRQWDDEDSAGWLRGEKQGFLRTAFNRSDKVELLTNRSSSDMEGMGAATTARMGRIVAEGIAAGKHPYEIADDLDGELDIGLARAQTIARTEVVRAHSEGQLDSFEALGVDGVEVEAEWRTASDDRVCEQCSDMEGEVFSVADARGMIPVHPNCRCAFVPAGLSDKDVDWAENTEKQAVVRLHAWHAPRRWVDNAFCPTGPGGGQDNSCGSGKGGGWSDLATPKGKELPQRNGQVAGVDYEVNPSPQRLADMVKESGGRVLALLDGDKMVAWDGSKMLQKEMSNALGGKGVQAVQVEADIRPGSTTITPVPLPGVQTVWPQDWPEKHPAIRRLPFAQVYNRSYFADCERDARGRCMPAGGGGEGYASSKEMEASVAIAKAKGEAAPVPTAEKVAKMRAALERAKTDPKARAGGDARGNSYARRARAEKLFEEFGGNEKGYVVCPWTGLKMHYTDDPKLNPNGYPKFEQGKIFTAKQGGGYQMENLIPESFAANRSRNDTPTRQENQGTLAEVKQAEKAREKAAKTVKNAWCPTGPGGGQDNSCSSSGSPTEGKDAAEGLKALVESHDTLPHVDAGTFGSEGMPSSYAMHLDDVAEHVEKLEKLSKKDLYAAAVAAGVEGAKPGEGKDKLLQRIRNRLTARVRAFERAQV